MGLNSPLNSSACKPIICHLIHTTLGLGFKRFGKFCKYYKDRCCTTKVGEGDVSINGKLDLNLSFIQPCSF
jgi:hypothetical protein